MTRAIDGSLFKAAELTCRLQPYTLTGSMTNRKRAACALHALYICIPDFEHDDCRAHTEVMIYAASPAPVLRLGTCCRSLPNRGAA